MMGGALGLAILASIAAARTAGAVSAGKLEALVAGYHAAFLVGSIFALTGALLAAFFLKITSQPPAEAQMMH